MSREVESRGARRKDKKRTLEGRSEQAEVEPEEQKPEEIHSGFLQIVENKPAENMKQKKEQQHEMELEAKRKWNMEHKDKMLAAVRKTRIKNWLLENKFASSSEEAKQLADSFFNQGLITITAVKQYYLSQHKKQEQKPEAPEQKPEEQKEEATK